jgi:hypothetical protein
VPQITHANRRPCTVLGQLGAPSCDDVAPPRTRTPHAGGLGQRPTRPWWADDVHPLVRRASSLLVLVKDAFGRRDHAAGIAVHHSREARAGGGAGRQERGRGAQATPRDAPAACDARVMPLLRGPGALSGWPRKPVLPPPTTRLGPDWEGERVKPRARGGGRPAHLAHAPRARRLALPEGGGVPHHTRALCEGGEARALVRPAIGAESRLPGQLEKGPAHAPGEDLDRAPLGYTTAVPYGTSRGERSLRCLSHTVHRHEKRIAVHGRSPRRVVVPRQLFYEEGSNGSPQELHIRY